MRSVVSSICSTIRAHRRFLLCGHVRPDGDCIGSQLSFYQALLRLNKIVRLYNRGPILKWYQFLPGIKQIERKLPKEFNPEVTIFVDCGSVARVNENFRPQGVIINIDHHHHNSRFGHINYVDPRAGAVGELVYKIIKALGVKLDPDIANCLYLSIMADTGSFQFPNTSATTFRMAADLMKSGAEPAFIAQNYLGNRPAKVILLMGEVLRNLNFELGGSLAWGEITQSLYQRCGGELNEPEGLMGLIRSIKGVEVAVLIHELRQGGLRAGFRSKGNIDVSVIAEELDGGGHPNASGCYIQGDYNQLKQKLLQIAKKHIMAQQAKSSSA